jgi:hypothetical protein
MRFLDFARNDRGFEISSSNQTACHKLRAGFEKLSQKLPVLPALETLLQDFISTGTIENFQKLREPLSQLTQAREQIMKDYQEKARQILREWHPGSEEEKDDFIGKISFEDSGRVVIEGDLDLRDQSLDYFSSLVKTVEGDLDLTGNKFVQIDYLEEVGRWLSAENLNDLSSMRSLRKVGGALIIQGTRLTSLDSLEYVQDSIHASNVQSLASMKNLRLVGGSLYINNTSLSSLDNLEEVGGILYAANLQNLTSARSLKTINYSLFLTNTQIDDFLRAFPSLHKIGKDRDGVSIYLSIGQEDLKQQIEELKEEGKLSYEGKIKLIY